MTKSIFRCTSCNKYTLNEDICPICGSDVENPHPARFSIEKEKKYSKYRRELIKDKINKESS